MSGLKEVGFVIDSLTINLNSANEVVNMMASGRGLSVKGLTTRNFKFNLSSSFSSQWKSSLRNKIYDIVSERLEE